VGRRVDRLHCPLVRDGRVRLADREDLQRGPRPRAGARRRRKQRAERRAPCAYSGPPRPLVPRRRKPRRPSPVYRHDLQAGGMTMLAVIRPDSWNYPLFLHVLGAMILVGALVTAVTAQVLSWKRGGGADAAAYARLAFRTLLFVGIPASAALRLGARRIYSKDHWGDVAKEPDWLGIGY